MSAFQSADVEGLAFEHGVLWLDDHPPFAGLANMAGMESVETAGFRDVQDLVGVAAVDEDCEAGAHVVASVHLFVRLPAVFLDEVKDRQLCRQLFDEVLELLRRAHELAPAVAGDVHCIVHDFMHLLVVAAAHERDVQVRGIEQGFAVGTAIRELRLVTFGKPGRDLACRREPVGVDAGAFEEDDVASFVDFARLEQVFHMLDVAPGRARKQSGAIDNNACKCRSFTRSPGAAALHARQLPAMHEICSALLVVEPCIASDSDVHGHRDRQDAHRDHVVHDHGHGVLSDEVVAAAAEERATGVCHQVLGAEPFFDLADHAAPGVAHQVHAFAARPVELSELARRDVRGRARRVLAHALERVKRPVVDAACGVDLVCGHCSSPVCG